jgi:predicted permease
MSWTRFFRRRRWDEERARELEAYLEMETDENIARGMTPEEARYAARRKLGNTTRIREEIYRMNSLGWLETLWQDLRYALRQLRRSPGLTAVILLSLTLGIGANTAVFTLVDAVMFKQLPVKNPQQLVLLGWVRRHRASFDVSTSGYGLPDSEGREVRAAFAYPLVEQLRSLDTAFSSVFGFVPMGWGKESVNLTIDGQTTTAEGCMVTGGYFSGLGIVPAMGRLLTDADLKESAPRVVVISYNFWTRGLGRSPSAVGKTAFLNGIPFSIVGVAPRGFFGVDPGVAPDVWVPLVREERVGPYGGQAPPGWDRWTKPDWWWVMIMARLKPGVSQEQALAAAKGPFFRSAKAAARKDLNPADAPPLLLIPASRGIDMLRAEFAHPLWLLTVLVAIVLLIACANVATLLIARAMARQREVALRQSVGASRARLIRQFLTESVLLSVMGGFFGLVFAQWGSRVLLLLLAGNGITLDLGSGPDLTVLGFCAGLSLFTGILFGLAPAIRATRVDVGPTLQKPASGFATVGRRLSLGKALVMAQVALCFVLLVGAGLFVRTLSNLVNQNLGFNRRNLLIFAIDPPKSGYKGREILGVCGKVRERLQAVPGVQAVTFSGQALLTGYMGDADAALEGDQAKPPGLERRVELNSVGPGFFDTMGIRLVLGRPIESRDSGSATRAAVVNAAMARHFFGDSNPLGRRFSFSDTFYAEGAYEIVGVVENSKYESLWTDPRVVYLPFRQEESGSVGRTFFEVRTAADPTAFFSAVRGAVREVDPTLGLESMKTQNQQISEALTEQRMFAELSAFFGVLALGLAAIGLYGLMAYSVTQRTNEFGIRMALGAQPRQVLCMVLGQSIGLVGTGLVAGLLAAVASTSVIASELYGLKPTDPLTLGFATFFMVAVAALAAYLPARRATKVDPMVALRYE